MTGHPISPRLRDHKPRDLATAQADARRHLAEARARLTQAALAVAKAAEACRNLGCPEALAGDFPRASIDGAINVPLPGGAALAVVVNPPAPEVWPRDDEGGGP